MLAETEAQVLLVLLKYSTQVAVCDFFMAEDCLMALICLF